MAHETLHIQKFSNATQEQCDAIVIVNMAGCVRQRPSLIRISACGCDFQMMKM